MIFDSKVVYYLPERSYIPVWVEGQQALLQLAPQEPNAPISNGYQLILRDPAGQIVDLAGNIITLGSAEILTGLDGASVSGQDALIQTQLDAAVAAGGTIRRIGTGGIYRINTGVLKHPMLSWAHSARGHVIFEGGDNMPATNAAGAENAMFTVVARTHADDGGTLSYTGEISGFNINGRKASQVNLVHGIREANPDPGDNPFDADPGFTTNKDYASDRFRNLEIVGCSGDGIVVEAGRGRPHFFDVRCLSNGGNGLNIKSNDMVVGDRCGFGGNGGHGLLMGGGSGGLVHDINAWTSPSLRRISALAIKFNQTAGYSFRGSMINDTVWFHGASEKRGGISAAVLYSPHDEIFDSDGHTFDNDATGNPQLQSYVAVDGYKTSLFVFNAYLRTKKVNFATPSNVGGDLTGKEGTGFQWCMDVSDDAEVSLMESWTSRPDYRPWTDASYVPINTRTGGKATYIIFDPYIGLVRIGVKGAGIDSHVMLATDASLAPQTDFAVTAGKTNKRNQMLGATEFEKAPLLQTTGYDAATTADGGVGLISGDIAEKIFFTGTVGGIATYEIRLPYIHNGSKRLTILFVGKSIDAVTWKTFSADDTTLVLVGGVGDTANDQTEFAFPKVIQGLTRLDLFWREDIHQWYVESHTRLGKLVNTVVPAAGGTIVSYAVPYDQVVNCALLVGIASCTLQLPADAVSVAGQEIAFVTTQAIAAFTVTQNGGGGTFTGFPAALAANDSFRAIKCGVNLWRKV